MAEKKKIDLDTPSRPEDRTAVDEDYLPRVHPAALRVELPAGGQITLHDGDEVLMWNSTRDRYMRENRLTKTNDLVQLGAILSQALVMYRAQRDLSSGKNVDGVIATLNEAAKAIRDGEKALGLDKATRERGGQQTVGDYVTRLKKFGYRYGVHISDRVKAYEALAMEARWKIRLLRNGDLEDRSYHGVQTEKQIVDWLERELADLETKDKEWAKEHGAVMVGKL